MTDTSTDGISINFHRDGALMGRLYNNGRFKMEPGRSASDVFQVIFENCYDLLAERDTLAQQLAEARNSALEDAWDQAESEILDFPFGEGTDQEAMLERVERVIRALKSEPAPRHPDDEAVDRFASAMKEKLAAKRADGRGGWNDKTQCSQKFLSDLLRGHVSKGDPLDVANFSMMLHQRGEAIAQEGQDNAD